jgi:hypothetical protein
LGGWATIFTLYISAVRVIGFIEVNDQFIILYISDGEINVPPRIVGFLGPRFYP